MASRGLSRSLGWAAIVMALAQSPTLATAQGKPAFEADPVLSAPNLVPAALLKGPNFTLDTKVPVTGFMERFIIRSPFGLIPVVGKDLLPVRVGEVPALAELEATTKTGEFVKAAGRAAAKPVKAAANMIMNPVDTVKGVPGAVGRFFDRVELGGKKIAEAGKGSPPKEGAELAGEVGKRVGMTTINVLGFEQERRQLAKRLSVDPYTTNPILAAKLDEVAWVGFSGRFAVNTTISILAPYSLAISATSVANDMVWDTPPADLINLNERKLVALGASEVQARTLLRNPFYSLTVVTAFVTALEQLSGVPGRNGVVSFAATATTEIQARLITGAVQMLARYHASGEPLTEVAGPGPILAKTRSGALLVAIPLDYVTWTQRVATFSQRPDLRAANRIAWTTGRFSPRAKQEMGTAGWKVREGMDGAQK